MVQALAPVGLVGFGSHHKLINPFGDFGSRTENRLRDIAVAAVYDEIADYVGEHPGTPISRIYDHTASMAHFYQDRRDNAPSQSDLDNEKRFWYFDFFDKWLKWGVINKRFTADLQRWVGQNIGTFKSCLQMNAEALDNNFDEWRTVLTCTENVVGAVSTFAEDWRTQWLGWLGQYEQQLPNIARRAAQANTRLWRSLASPSTEPEPAPPTPGYWSAVVGCFAPPSD
ncbi:MAG: hypothetical protein KC474_11045 [Cyanobacteria bacterium HKST-UBA04]|nr:hypothetical protein [Cyanobacteria bacterium HKST-UBA04]